MAYVFNLSKPYERYIKKVLDLLNRELVPNYKAMAARAGLGRTTLSRRFRGITISRAESNLEIRQCLINAQEEALIKQINKLLIRNMPLTSQIFKNFAKEIYKRKIYKNQIANFVYYYKDRLKLAYLQNINKNYAKAIYKLNV